MKLGLWDSYWLSGDELGTGRLSEARRKDKNTWTSSRKLAKRQQIRRNIPAGPGLWKQEALAFRPGRIQSPFASPIWAIHLDAPPSLLNPIWYAGAFALGLTAGRLGDPTSLGFLVETERQVETHLAGHMERLPLSDHVSRAIVEQMKDDEARHAREAFALGAKDLPRHLKTSWKSPPK